jgi:endogenous inhibitor of DNA gyrase (YacG/DUF329 family)
MNTLVPCPECNRHVRRHEMACPFCGAPVAEAMSQTPERAMPTTRLGRSALFVFAAVSVGAAGCGGNANTDTSKTGFKGDAATNGGASSTGGQLGMPHYGAPGPTGGLTGAGGARATGGEFSVPPYGLPPPLTGGAPNADAGNDGAAAGGSGGGFGPVYGVPAPK